LLSKNNGEENFYATGYQAILESSGNREKRKSHYNTELPVRPSQIQRLLGQTTGKQIPGDVSRDHIRDYLMWLSEVGHQKPNGPSARARALAAIRSFFKYARRAGLLRDNPAADIPLPKIRTGEVRALSQDECDRLFRMIGTNPSPFREVRDRAMIVTFLLTGAWLREIVNLDKGDVDLYQSTIRLHRKGGEVNILPLADSAKIEINAYLKESRIKTHGMGPHALRHTFATLLLYQEENLRVIQSLINHKSLATNFSVPPPA
jgi:site-specific recombinase XerD